MKNPTKSERLYRLISSLQSLGFTFEEAHTLRRAQMTLHRWAEQECGDGNDYAAWSIERDETTGKPFRCVYPHDGKSYRTATPDREAGALRRIKAVTDARNARIRGPEGEDRGMSGDVLTYHQTDPRGCALYLVKASDVRDGESIDSVYNRGLAVCA